MSLIDWLVQNEPSFRKTRLPSLYSDLSIQKSSNPDGYAANVTAWQTALSRASLAGKLPPGDRLILHTSNELLDELSSPQYGRPSGLGSVIDEAVRNGKMIDLREFSTAERSISHKSWVPSPWSLLQWSLRQIGLAGSYDVSGRLKAGNLVLIEALEQVSREIITLQLKKGQSMTDRVMSIEVFLQNITSVIGENVSKQEQEVLLRYLHRDKQVLSYNSTTVKFKSPTSDHPEPITAQDHSIANLKLVIANLELQVTSLTTRITSLQSSAAMSVKSGNKSSALSALRSKKLAEKNLQQRTDTLHQLEEVYSKIEQAADQVDVVKAMEASTSVLTSLNKQIGGVEKVEDIVDRLREEMGKVDEVGQAINEPLDPAAQLDEAELDEEFEILEKEEKRKLEEKEAEATRERLQELEKLEKEQKASEGFANSVGEKKMNAEDELEKSTRRLSTMSIEDTPNNKDGDKKSERIPEQI